MTRKAQGKATDMTLPVGATLTHAAAKLYIHLIRMDGGYESNAELMRNSGISDHRTYRAALAQLRDAGWVDSVTGEVRGPGMVTVRVGTDGAVANGRSGGITTNQWESWYEEARAADRMPNDGAPTSKPFLERRRAQVQAIQTAWRAVFPGATDMTRDAVKRCLLLLTPDAWGEEAETIVEVIEHMREMDNRRKAEGGKPANTVAYLQGILRNRRKKALADRVGPWPEAQRTSANFREHDGDVA